LGGVKMDLDKLSEKIEATEIVEELVALSEKVVSKNTEEVKNVIEMFITKSYLMGKKNMIKTFD
jgi:disulfide oxidoreductase YuzD